MKKLYEMGAKTGLTRGEVRKMTGFGLLGFVALIFSFFSSCAKNGAGQKEAVESGQPAGRAKELLNPVSVSTDSIIDDNPQEGDNCGPTPGYPCGSRYYTVSLSDFRKTV